MIRFFKKKGKDISTKYAHISKKDFPFFFEKMYYVNVLENKFPNCFEVEDDKIKFISPYFSSFITTREELFILAEVLVDKCYDFEFEDSIVVFDIGMNVGFASLFFASKNNVEKIIGFEPLIPTFNQAIDNFRLNPLLIDKLIPNNYGLGDRDETLHIDYSYKYKGNVGIHGITENLKPDDLVKEKIEIKEAKRILNSYIETKERKFLLKLDCEGCEYQIIDNLCDSGYLKDFDFLFIEYHKGNPAVMINNLTKNGFFVTRQLINDEYGIIYATKTND